MGVELTENFFLHKKKQKMSTCNLIANQQQKKKNSKKKSLPKIINKIGQKFKRSSKRCHQINQGNEQYTEVISEFGEYANRRPGTNMTYNLTQKMLKNEMDEIERKRIGIEGEFIEKPEKIRRRNEVENIILGQMYKIAMKEAEQIFEAEMDKIKNINRQNTQINTYKLFRTTENMTTQMKFKKTYYDQLMCIARYAARNLTIKQKKSNPMEYEESRHKIWNAFAEECQKFIDQRYGTIPFAVLELELRFMGIWEQLEAEVNSYNYFLFNGGFTYMDEENFRCGCDSDVWR